jgi:nitrite reductase/ring-hydroxylating ferredoxin subunit
VLVNVTGTRIALGRCPEGLVAFSDRCTHKGGSLADGALVGCTVQCPWHGSQFNVHTGRVVNGPAQHRIEAFDVVVENEDVFIRPRHARENEEAA